MRKLIAVVAAVGAGLVVTASPALAAPRYTLFGDALRVHPGNHSHTAIQLRSVGAGFGGIDYKVPSGMTFSQLQDLSTDYMFTAATCGQGSPRFQVNIDGKNAFVYIGPPPNYTGCPENVWLNTGNLATPAGFIDTSQLPGGTFYVTGIQLVADAGYFFGTQTVQVDNTTINNARYTYENQGRGGGDEQGEGDGDD
ncbi:MAG: hypothetical protein E6J28_01260 [Chloroflexi bacterium]|nr:MAG: hypothetical protein E6J28_01260 [Chloroflexota bacterium]